MKTFVLMVSKKFPAYHPRKGQRTKFKSKIKSGEKTHTIRGNWAFWYLRAVKIELGMAELSVRQWSGEPYRSKQVEIARFKKIHVQPITIFKKASAVRIETEFISDARIRKLAKNDGLSIKDFRSWFKDNVPNGVIIHFTKFAY